FYGLSRLRSLHVPEGKDIRLCPVAVTEMAKEVGSPIMKNMIACGVSAGLVGLSPDAFDSLIEDRFGKKGEHVVAKNKEAVKKGYDYALAHFGQLKKLPDPEPEEDGGGHLFLSGNEAVALGALAE